MPTSAGTLFDEFVAIIARLRGPDGCPWDREQTHASLKPMTIEETYEVIEAIDDGDRDGLAGELGDLLLQVVFHSQIAQDDGAFDVRDVVARASDKMKRRHPHVFADAQAPDAAAVLRSWEQLKRAERAADGRDVDAESLLDGVSGRHPALLEAYQLTQKAARVGFDWSDAAGALDKVDEELVELRRAAQETAERERIEDELGDLLFAAVNVARKLGTDPESALKRANRKFRRRFRHIENALAERGRAPAAASLEEMDALWDDAKRSEGAANS